MRGLGFALIIPIALIVALWFVGKVVGFEVSLLGSLGLTLVLTIVLNLVMRAFSNRRGTYKRW